MENHTLEGNVNSTRQDPPSNHTPERNGNSTRQEAPSNQKKDEPKETFKKLEAEAESVNFKTLLRYATPRDKLLMTIGGIAAVANGAALPAFSILFGNVSDKLVPGAESDLLKEIGIISAEFLGLGIASFILSYISFATWMITSERQTIEIRKRYFRSLLSQEIAFFDSINPNEISSKIAEECFQIQGGIGEKVATFIYSISMLITGFVIGYIFGWQLALVLTSVIPLIAISGTLFVVSIQKQTTYTAKSYAEAGAISEEALNGIKTVASLSGQEKELGRYKGALVKHKKTTAKFAIFSGAAMGLVWFSLFGMYALGFWYGAKLIHDRTENAIRGRPYQGGDVLIVFFSIMFAGFSISQASPAFKKFAEAKSAGGRAFKIIDRKSQISVEDEGGIKPDSIQGVVEFKDVKFAYPSKPDRPVLKGISLTANTNEKVAFVGESGCGKTTCVQLIERFYDFESGSLTIDGHEVKELNLRWLRENIGYVGQEPVLFATSIKENLLLAKEDATDEEVWDALKKANASDFVSLLPDKLNTFVGTNATQLSGGQKQRLAIARAILKNPAILLLDEATSALDRKNELEIQKTLDEIAKGRTTITIAHRLTTVQNADKIVVFDQGQIVEQGSHEELVNKKGRYYHLQKLQIQIQEEEEKAISKGEEGNVLDPQEIDDVPNERTIEMMEANNLSKKAIDEIDIINTQPQAMRVKPPENLDPTVQESPEFVALDVEKNAEEKKKAKKAARAKAEKQLTRRLLDLNKEGRGLLIVGLIFSGLAGTCFPFSAIIISSYLEVFADPDAPDFTSRSVRYAIYYIIIGLASFVFGTIQLSVLNIVGENLSRKIRIEVFKKYLYNEIGWFDLPENAPGVLISRLSTESGLVNSLASTVLGVFVQAFSSFITGTVIAFIASWQLTFVALALSPLVIISGVIEAKFQAGFSDQTDEAYRESVNFASEAVNNMRTVASFAKEDRLLRNYSTKLEAPLKLAVKKGNTSGLLFGFSQLGMFVNYAVVFFVGAVFINAIDLGYKDLFLSIFAILFAAYGAGNAMQYAPDVGSARAAGVSIFEILDREPKIKIDAPNQIVRGDIKGEIEFKNVWFKYPTRTEHVLKGVNFKVHPSSKVAFVGSSGCGKSTIMSLLLRFYDVEKGEIFIDGVEIKNYDLRHLRLNFGVVSQEPTLFNGTIDYNIRYSKEDATSEEVRQAASEANALSFIERNEFDDNNQDDQSGTTQNGESGFQRKVGPKGSQMSGGQKQRIAIARAIMNKPPILLLDEATSALDAESEKIVQGSLDKIMEGKTAIVIAHRISTVRDANEILVFNDGQVAEKGTYEELIKKQGMFYKLEKGIAL